EAFDGMHRLLAGPSGSGPGDLAAAAADVAPLFVATTVTIYLVDYAQTELGPLGAPDRDPLPVEGTLAGRAFTTGRAVAVASDGVPHLWLPLLDGASRLGVVEVVGATDDPDRPHRAAPALAAALGQLVETRRAYGDAIEHVRRRLPMQLA